MDVTTGNHSTLISFELHTDAAKEWVLDHLPAATPRMRDTVFVEPRYAGPIIEGMQGDGLEVS